MTRDNSAESHLEQACQPLITNKQTNKQKQWLLKQNQLQQE